MADFNNTQNHLDVAKAFAYAFDIIYSVDVKTNSFVKYSDNGRAGSLGIPAQGDDFHELMCMVADKVVIPADRDMLKHETERDVLLANLAESGRVSYTYRQSLKGKELFFTFLAILPEKDADHYIVAIRNVDAQVRREKSMEKKTDTYTKILSALARLYEVVYYVNTDTNEYTEFMSSSDYAALNMKITGKDFFADSQIHIQKNVCDEDIPMVSEAFIKENFMRRLDENGMYTLRYRFIFKRRTQYVALFVVRPEESSSHAIVALSNIDNTMRREIAITEALDKAMKVANRDELTGVKSKHAYANAVEELKKKMSEGTAEFAIVVADINGLKDVNDTRGHNAGDCYIKEACHIICSVFKHSPVYRIGGDEFVILLTGQDFHLRKILMDDFYTAMEANRALSLVTLAGGLAVFDPETDKSFADVFERADREMYANKHKMKGGVL